jgi:CRP/FNR family transcriptional regulator, cyclic AMP receptor protein
MNKDDAKWLLETLRKTNFFSIFTLENIDSILKHFKKYTYPKNKTVISEGEPGKAFFVIHSGKVKVLKKKSLWMKQEVAQLGPGDFFGEMSLISDQFATATIVPIENTDIFVLMKSDFDEVLVKNPGLAVELQKIAEKRRFDTQQKT